MLASFLLACGCRLPYPVPAFVKRNMSGPELRSIQGIDLAQESQTQPIQPKTRPPLVDKVTEKAPLPSQGRTDGTSKTALDELSVEKLTPSELASKDKTSDEKTASGVREAVEPDLSSQLPILAPTDPPQPISLAEARAAALRSNLDLAVALVDPAIARQVVNVEAARFQAVFDSSYVRNRVDSPPGFAAGGSPDTTFDRISASTTQPLTGGGRISLRHSIDKTAPHFVPFPDFVNTSAGLEFQQPLLRGAGYQVNTASIQIASTQAGIADARAKLTAIQVLSEVERAYWNAYAAQQFLAITQQQYGLAEKQVAATRILASKAIITIVDQQQSETGLLFRRSAVISAETNVRLAQRALKRIMQRSDLAVSSIERLDTITPPNPLGLTFNRQSLAERAIGNRMELLQNRLQLIANGLDIAVQQNSRLPRLDLIADLDALGLGGAYNDSFESLESGKFGNRLGGVSFQMPMGRNYAALARLEQANLRRRQLSIDQRRVSVAITQQVYDAIDRVELSWERYLIARESVTTAQKTFDGETKIFMSGKSTSINVLITISNLGDAQSQEVQAATDYQIAKVDLALAVGAMLGYGQVDWDPCRGATSALPE